ncbi:MAG: hypothetical protein Q4P06_08905 [Actinomycetaceae bacterium]|nr:hypothetical protein [Actinomycetaceae bacterium]
MGRIIAELAQISADPSTLGVIVLSLAAAVVGIRALQLRFGPWV